MKHLIILAIALNITACVGFNNNDVYETKIVTTTPNDSVEEVVREYNENRVTLGQDPVTQGLTCTLYTVPNTTTQIIGASLTSVGSWLYNGVFNVANGPSSPGLSIMPPAIQGLYTAYYVIKCVGLYIVAQSGWQSFDLTSDDGSNLYVSGLLINNDGTHGAQTKSAVKFLSRGVVSFELDAFDVGGSHALMLKSGGVPIPAENLYH